VESKIEAKHRPCHQMTNIGGRRDSIHGEAQGRGSCPSSCLALWCAKIPSSGFRGDVTLSSPDQRRFKPDPGVNLVRCGISRPDGHENYLFRFVPRKCATAGAPLNSLLEDTYQGKSICSCSVFAWKSERIAGPKFGHATRNFICLLRIDAFVYRQVRQLCGRRKPGT
jgi:hypothetical protein